MPRRGVLEAFKRLIEPELAVRGFEGRRGHFVRRTGSGVTQVIELQLSIYGGRITANLGLDLDALKPLVRWIASPPIGPHAHDATRWIRIGLVRPDHVDCWWSFDTDSSDAAKSAGRAILDHGIPWLDAESAPDRFLRYAEVRLDRSKSGDRPEGSFLELRLMAAVLAWNGQIAKARDFAEHARLSWPDEQERLSLARTEFRKKNPQVGRKIPEVPDIQAELDTLISGSTVIEAAPRAKRSKARGRSTARSRSNLDV